MYRYLALFVLAVMVVASVDTLEVLAGSSKNPYSGFNISGINYGAQQWERQHGGKSPQQFHSRGRFRRR